ncbi:MAG: hypothetical protein E7211_00895 [Clostridium lundense]|nr:hypothetical protein [Clostridium lundense]
MKDKIRTLLKELIDNLINKDYTRIIENKQNGRLSEEEISRAIYEYSRYWDIEGLITMPPKSEFEKLDLIKITYPPVYVLHFDLWINGEKSDLTLICDIEIDKFNNIVRFEIDDIHVM